MTDIDRRKLNQASRVALVSAQIAGELHRASIIAHRLSLAAQNSRTLAARVGNEAAGLDVLSEFFAQVAQQTIRLSAEVNQLATQIASNSVEQWRVSRFARSLDQSKHYRDSKEYLRFLKQLEDQAEQGEGKLNEVFSRYRIQLNGRLQELDSQMQTAAVLAANFRLEAVRAPGFEVQLRAMAQDLEKRSKEIEAHAKRSLSSLRELRNHHANN